MYGAFPVKWFFSVYCQFFVRRAVLHPVACDQVPGVHAEGMNREVAFPAKLGCLTLLYLPMIQGELAIEAYLHAANLYSVGWLRS